MTAAGEILLAWCLVSRIRRSADFHEHHICYLQIVEGRLEKIKRNFALLEQPALRDNNKTVAEIIKETIAATGENIQV